MQHMNPGLPNLAEQERARQAVVKTLEAAADLIRKGAQAHRVPSAKSGAAEADRAFESGIKAGMSIAASRLTEQATQTRRAAIL